MQLILITDSDIGIPRNMSVIEQESLSMNEKFINNDVKDKDKNDIPGLMEDIIDIDSENCKDNDNSAAGNFKRVSGNSEEKSDDEIQKVHSSDDESNQQDSNNSNKPSSEKENLNLTENNISDNAENRDENEYSEQLKHDKILREDVNDEDKEQLENKVMSEDLDNDDEVMSESTELKIQEISQRNEESMEESIEGVKTSICEESKTENEEIIQQKLVSAFDIPSGEEIDIEIKECNGVNKQDINEDSVMEKECDIENEISSPNVSCEKEKQNIVRSEFFMRIKKVSEINEESRLQIESDKEKNETISIELLDEAKNDEVTEIKTVSSVSETKEKDSEDLKNIEPNFNEKGNKCVENEEVIDVANEKQEECITVIDQDMSDVEKEPDKEIDLEDIESSENKRPKTDIECNSQENVVNAESEEKNQNLDQTNKTSENIKIPLDDDVTNSQSIKQVGSPKSSIKEKKPLLHISKLSNTLDILSDDEEEPSKEESQSTVKKQCINIDDDDDDIMLIDEENSSCISSNDNIMVPSETDKKNNEEIKKLGDMKEDVVIDVPVNNQDVDTEVEDDKVTETESNVDKQEKKTEEDSSIERTLSSKPLLPVNFLKTCKKNFAEMTREELEEFCILKIVESVADRSHVGEMNLQVKSLAYTVEEYKKRTNTLLKQNRDLQVVLLSLQEEMKKHSGVPLIPMKITRSVGMQVFLDDSNNRKKSLTPNKFQNFLHINSVKSKGQSPKSPKVQTPNNQQYPVPRLVPAVNNNNTNNKAPTPVPIAPKIQNIPNGLKNSPPIPKPEKRSFSKMQQGNSVTVDLTDDEPPPKVVQRNITAPVRLVPQQSLLNPQRPPFANAINSPRKVYIPISGGQNQNGQAVVLKQLNPHGPRVRGPAILPKPGNSVRMPKTALRHPAPLPESAKQCQPPIWKALPPAPELKLSKVENGIVISWKIDGYDEEVHEEIASYQLYAYQETSSPPSTALWKKIGDVKALALPMACTLTQFMSGYKYYFSVRAVDVRSRLGPFSLPGQIFLSK